MINLDEIQINWPYTYNGTQCLVEAYAPKTRELWIQFEKEIITVQVDEFAANAEHYGTPDLTESKQRPMVRPLV